ncbi:MAG TPA: FKBP-type peptidyl-prolyl cis-trans isomerase [Hanamia sp.]|jgi:FKBP-type peptidyl-prolyl cis-trans isomerase|nr:FKBP-type peptidyl-prolyl cis-trans isomerase [Hanamia sp.]
MKIIALLLLFPCSFAMGQSKKKVTTTAKTNLSKPTNSIDSLSYAIGVQVAEFYKQTQNVDKINPEFISRAFKDVYNNQPLAISEDEATMFIQQKLQEYMAKKIKAVKDSGQQFLAENKKKPGVVTLPDGLQYEIIKKGTGAVPTVQDTVKANYIGTLIDGKEFDNSYKRGEPLTIPVTGVIKGWTEALQLMPVGSTWKLYIPSDLAYGDRGAGGVIPGGATLIFTIELLDIVNK